MGNGEDRIGTLLKNSSSGIREVHLIVETLFPFVQSCDRIKSILVSNYNALQNSNYRIHEAHPIPIPNSPINET